MKYQHKGPFNNYVTLKTALFRPPLPYVTLRNKWLDHPCLLCNAHLFPLFCAFFCFFLRFNSDFLALSNTFPRPSKIRNAFPQNR